MSNRQSFESFIMLKPHKQGQGVKAEAKGGLAFASQKKSIVALDVMINAWHPNGTIIPAGSKAFVLEDKAVSQAWAKDVRTIEGTDENVIIVPFSEVLFFELPDA